MNPVRVLIVDDHSLFRKGVRAALESQAEIAVVGEAAGGAEAIRVALETTPDIILMDISMPGDVNGFEATRTIKQLLPSVRVIILTISDTDEDLFEAIKSGAQGYLQKDVDALDLGKLLLKAAGGEALLSGLLAARILQEFSKVDSQTTISPTEALTDRERDVLTLIVKGFSNREIAEKLCIAENTVKHHLSHILEKLHLHNRVQLVVYSLHEGLVKESP